MKLWIADHLISWAFVLFGQESDHGSTYNAMAQAVDQYPRGLVRDIADSVGGVVYRVGCNLA